MAVGVVAVSFALCDPAVGIRCFTGVCGAAARQPLEPPLPIALSPPPSKGCQGVTAVPLASRADDMDGVVFCEAGTGTMGRTSAERDRTSIEGAMRKREKERVGREREKPREQQNQTKRGRANRKRCGYLLCAAEA